MKTANTILLEIQSLPHFKRLKSHYCYLKFISLLPPKFQKAIAFVYVRDEILWVALSHPGFKMELNYNKDLLRELLKMLTKTDIHCKELKTSRTVLFNSKNHKFSQKKPKYNSIPYYQEMALGEFSIQSDDEELQKAFEKIRQSIESQQ